MPQLDETTPTRSSRTDAPSVPRDDTEIHSPLAAFLAAVEAELPLGAVYNRDSGMVMAPTAKGELVELSSPIRVEALARTSDGDRWTTQVTFPDPDGRLQKVNLQNEDLEGRPSALVSRLARRGFKLKGTANQLAKLLKAWEPERKLWLADQPGWLQMGQGEWVYVDSEGRTYAVAEVQRASAELAGKATPMERSGRLDDWRATVGTFARGNPALIAAISTALVGPLLRISGLKTLGINFHAMTSSGKSTALAAALSCYREPSKMGDWNATAAALERRASTSNDALLALDEVPSKPGRDMEAKIYMLGNGVGRGRSGSGKEEAETEHFRLALLSTSERPISEHLSGPQWEMSDGLAARLIDVPAGAWSHRLFENLHGHADGHSFAGAIANACREHHGHVVPAFLAWFVRKVEIVEAWLERVLAEFERLVADRAGTVQGLQQRVVRRLGLVAVAGELGAHAGLLPWDRREAFEALVEIAALWKEDHDRRQTPAAEDFVETLRTLIAATARFEDLDDPGPIEGHPAGWLDAEWAYISPDVFADEVAGELGVEAAARHLQSAGYLRAGGEKNSLQYRLPGRRVAQRPRVYRVSREWLEEP